MKDFWKEPEAKKINIKKIIIISIIAILVIFLITISIIYVKNTSFREWIDTNILRKEVEEEKLATIEIKEEENTKICAFNQYIGTLSKNEFKLYNNTGKEEKSQTIEITNPIFNTNGRYLAIAEEKGQKIYFMTDKEISWEKTIEGNISQIQVSQNGYVAVAIVGTTHKTVITVYNDKGETLFTRFLSTARVSDISISQDNKYLAIAEIDTSGIVIESTVEIISIEKATNKTESNNSSIALYKFDDNELITNIEYQEKDKLICVSKDNITSFDKEGNKTEIINNKDKKTSFQTIQLKNNVVSIEEKASSLFTADSIVRIINTDTKNEITYTANAVTKNLYTYENIIALNLGAEADFVNTGGWLVKRYKANQEISDIVISGNLAGIIYRDKIEIINL